MTVQINKNLSNSNNLTHKSNWKTDYKKEPSEYTVVDKSTIFFYYLQNSTNIKTYGKVVQLIDSFIDELVKRGKSSFASQSRTLH